MKALVLTQYNRLELLDVPDPTPEAGEVLVAVRACGICGSDVHGLDGSTGRRRPPIVMGHEAAGQIVALGKNVRDWAVGDRVTFDSTIWCGECAFCRSGRINLCDRRRVLGVSCDEYRRDGAFAEFVAVPERILCRLPDALDFRRAALVEPVSIAMHAVRRAAMQLNETALVIGSGMIGLLIVQMLRASGCRRIFAADLSPERLKMAAQFGATDLLVANQVDVAVEVVRQTNNRGADVVFEAVGVAATVNAAVASLRKGGRLALVGNVTPRVELPLQAVVSRELTLLGSCASAGEYPDCLDMLARGAIAVEPLISAAAPLAEGAQWFDRLYRAEPGLMKVVLEPS